MELEHLRREYLGDGLTLEKLLPDPIKQFEKWLEQAINLEIADPTAMVLATVGEDGQPSQRIVLLKHLDDRGFVFFTNYGSLKARELADNNKACLLFPWHGINRQVKIVGSAKKVTYTESFNYFLSRPEESQLAAWASKQSRPISSRQVLLTQLERMKAKFTDGKVPFPDFWGGFRIVPEKIEFWQGAQARLHDRFEYRLDANQQWHRQRLAP